MPARKSTAKQKKLPTSAWDAASKSQLTKIFSKLYPDPRSELNFENEYQLIVSVILSAQCTDKKVNEVTPALFARYTSFQKLSMAKIAGVEGIIRPVNYYKTKSKNLIGMASMVCKEFSGKLPQSHKDLLSLPGVGNKTANVIQSELGTAPAFPVDTHVFRVSNRLELVQAKTPDEAEEQLKGLFRPEQWRNYHHWLIFHGRRVCKAQRPNCVECQLSKLCPSANI